jgi:hypothetical protein
MALVAATDYGSKAYPNSTHHCALISDNEEYHYNGAGWAFLAKQVEGLLRTMLTGWKQQHEMRSTTSGPNAHDQVDQGRVGEFCGDGKTFCATGTTCVKDSFSNTKWGCCMVADAVDCGDSWHCCDKGAICSYNATWPTPPKGQGAHVCTSP